MRNLLKLFIFFALSVIPAMAMATQTRYWKMATFESFSKGEAKGSMVTSDGRVVPGMGSRKMKMEGKAPSFFRKAVKFRGTLYAISGMDAGVWKVAGGRVTLVTSPKEEVLFTDAVVCGGRMLVSAVPSGTIFSFDGRALKPVTTLQDGHVLSMACLSGVTYVGTGPEGILYRLDGSNLVKVWDSKEKHLLSLLPYKGRLYVGTGPEARLFSFDPAKGRATLVYDFGGNEITTMVVHDGNVYVAANSIKYKVMPQGGVRPTVPKGPKPTKGTQKVKTGRKTPYNHPVSGVGYLMKLTPDRAASPAVMLDDAYITSAFVLNGTIYVTTSGKGGLYAYDPRRNVVSRPLDLEERQLLWVVPQKGGNGIAFTGDGGAVYEFGPGIGKDHSYESTVLDAGQSARFTMVEFDGSNVQIQTRTGMSDKPDDTWTAWKPLSRVSKGMSGVSRGSVTSPAGRYFQYRVLFRGKKAELRMIRVFYATVNLPPRLLSVDLTLQDGTTPKEGENKDTTIPDNPGMRKGTVKISWAVDNPDEDTLWYSVWVRRIGQKVWFPLTPRGPITATSLEWNAASFQDGLYLVRVRVSDEPSNPHGAALSHEKVSQPFVVDNHAPVVRSITIKPSARMVDVTFGARDGFSRLTAASVRVDDGVWMAVVPKDGVFDSSSESFSVRLGPFDSGYHLLQVRVRDEGGNIVTRTQEFRVK